ncbi:MAG: hypothetical protein Phyf2KO_12560 [Phycisphaerales bacterium]
MQDSLAEFSDRFIEIIGPLVRKRLGLFDALNPWIFHHALQHRDAEQDTVRVMPYSRSLFTLLCLFAVGMPAWAQDDAERVSLMSEVTFDSEPQTTKPAPMEPYGSKDTQFYMLGTTLAPDFTGNFDASIHGQYTYFVIDDFEVGVEAALWGFFQDNNTTGLSSNLVMRYHFYQARRWSAFAELGIGVMLAADNVPDDGTNFNLMPRAGAGITYQIFDDQRTRLITGLRWHHISNARLAGEERNPARDAPGLYVGLLYEF